MDSWGGGFSGRRKTQRGGQRAIPEHKKINVWLFFKILWGFTGLVISRLFCFLNYLGFYLSWLEDQSSVHQSCVRHGNIVILDCIGLAKNLFRFSVTSCEKTQTNLLANAVKSRKGHHTKRKSAVFFRSPQRAQTSMMILGWKFFHLLKIHCIWAEFVPSIWLGTAVGDQEKWIFFPQSTVIRGEISKQANFSS